MNNYSAPNTKWIQKTHIPFAVLQEPQSNTSLDSVTKTEATLHWICFFLKIFLMWTIFKVFIEFVTILLLFYVSVFWPRGMWDLSSTTRDWTCTPCIGRQSLNHWTAREVLAWNIELDLYMTLKLLGGRNSGKVYTSCLGSSHWRS